MITLMTPLHLAACFIPDRVALVSDSARLTYRELYRQAQFLARLLHARYQLREGMVLGILCRNHILSTLLLPAASRLGVHVRLLNTDIPALQMSTLFEGKYHLLVYDEEVRAHCLPDLLPCPAVSTEALSSQLSQIETAIGPLPKVRRCASLSVFTGGTSGRYKETSRKTRLLPFVSPFMTLLHDVGILRCRSVLIALPFYHGFGLSTLIVSLLLGKKICLLRHFDAAKVLRCIQQEQIEALPAVPAMLARLWQQPSAIDSMKSLTCIISGGDRLDPALARHTLQQLGPILYNLYGTSEAGFLMLAKPEQLSRTADGSVSLIGRPVRGVKCEIRNADEQGIGTLWVRCSWAMAGKTDCWQNTGDRVHRDSAGLYHHHGRADRIVVCGGENVCLDHIEAILTSHPAVLASVAYPAQHPAFGQVVHAKVELAEAGSLTDSELLQWLSSRLSRAEMPHKLQFTPIELLSTGKRK